jgi:molecular chaperone GrpE
MSEFKQTPPAARAAGGANAAQAAGGAHSVQAAGGAHAARAAGGDGYSSGPLRAHARAGDARAQGDPADEHTSAARPDDGLGGSSREAPLGDAAPASDGAARAGEAGEVEGEAGEVDVAGDIDELLKLTAQRDEYLSLAQRTQADFENYRKRVARENKQALERGVTKVVKELLPALDNLDRAIAAAASEDPLLEGVRLVRAEISAALARVGVESFSPAGETFDPAVHEAMASIDQPEGGAASGTVAEVYQPGYRLGETIIRPARVVVAA